MFLKNIKMDIKKATFYAEYKAVQETSTGPKILF